MELYITIPGSVVYGTSDTEYSLSLFGDETIELTKTWGTSNMINGYGSYSKSFSIPADAHNMTILKNYNMTTTGRGTNIDPNILYDAKIIVNGYEIIGNIQLEGYSYKDNKPYSFNLVFYGTENNLMKLLNVDMNTLSYGKDFPFQFNWKNVTDTWDGTEKTTFVPIMATKRPFNFRDTTQLNNINYACMKTSGVTMSDLIVSYNMIDFLGNMFDDYDIILNLSSGTTSLLYELYIAFNTKKSIVDSGSTLTNIHVVCSGGTDNYLLLNPPGYNNTLDSRWYANGILKGNTDFTSWSQIYNYTGSTNKYLAGITGTYNFNVNIKEIDYIDIPEYNYVGVTFSIINDTTLLSIAEFSTVESYINFNVNLLSGTSYRVLCNVLYSYYIDDVLYTQYQSLISFSGDLRIQLTSQADVYDYLVNNITFPNITTKDFFIDFCKTFDLFYEYRLRWSEYVGYIPVVFLYTFNELPLTIYDLSQYKIIQDTTFYNEQKYKVINYKWKVGTDINNIFYKRSIDTDTLGKSNFGEVYSIFSQYEVGIDKLEYTSKFSTFPYTLLNRTDDNNVILETLNIPLHSELNESLTPIQTDFLLFYKETKITGLTYEYGLQNDTNSYIGMDYVSNYSTDRLDFSNLTGKVIRDNTFERFETQMSFILPFEILYNLKVYDKIIVDGIYYTIKNMDININTGYIKIKLLNTLNAIFK